LPVSVCTAAPAAVSGISAEYISEEEVVLVEWEEVENASSYRVYFSSRSILGNGGVYDDFVGTEGPVSEISIPTSMLSERVFVSVLAVNESGEESSVFLEETSALLSEASIDEGSVEISPVEPAQQESSSSASSSEDTTQFNVVRPVDADPEEQSSSSETTEILEPVRYEEGALHLILAYAQEPTSVTLTFNSVPFVDPTLAPNAFKIIDSNGLPLRIAGLYIKDHTILVRTETQVKDEMYQVLLSEPLMEIRGGSLDATNRTASFQGHIDGVSVRTPSPDPIVAPVPMPVVPSEQPCDPRSVANPPSVTNLRLRSVAQTNGTHNVDARWSVAAGTCQPLLSYLVRQSNDRGRTFTQPQVVPAGTDGIDIPGVHAGEYGIGVSVVSPQGGVSKEVFARIELPISGNSAVIVPEIIITETPAPPTYISPIVSGNKRPLPSTGAGILIGGLSALGGAAIIRKKTRKQKK
jgi:hypothetical protein